MRGLSQTSLDREVGHYLGGDHLLTLKCGVESGAVEISEADDDLFRIEDLSPLLQHLDPRGRRADQGSIAEHVVEGDVDVYVEYTGTIAEAIKDIVAETLIVGGKIVHEA